MTIASSKAILTSVEVSEEETVTLDLKDRLLKLQDKVSAVKLGSQDKIVDALDMVIFVSNLAKDQPLLKSIIEAMFL